MHKRTLLAVLTTAAVTAVVTPSVSGAQQPTQTAKGEVAIQPNFGSLIFALNSTAAHNDKLKAMTELTAANVQLVNVEDLLKGNNVEALTNALQKNETDVTALRTTLGANTTITSTLTTNTVPLTTTDVIATDVGADGKVVVYFWKKAQ